MEMESSGKSTTLDGNRINYTTGTVIFGAEGCNGQHSFNQLLHQGQHLISVDFILTAQPYHHLGQPHHDLLLASALSQAYALMQGKINRDGEHEMHGSANHETEKLRQHHAIDGNKPSNILMLDRLNPRNLGYLLAIYEHKNFCAKYGLGVLIHLINGAWS